MYAVVGENCGKILNLTAKEAESTRNMILEITKENPDKILNQLSSESLKNSHQLEFDTERNLIMPSHHEVKKEDVDLKRLGGVLATA